MNKKISLGVAVSLVAIGCAITFVLTWTVSLNIYNSKISSVEKYEGVYETIRQMDAVVRNNYIGTIYDDAIQNGILNGYVNGIGDVNAAYMLPNAYYQLQQIESGVVNGAGFEAYEDGSGYLVVSTVYKNSSADINGMLPGDIITEIDGRNVMLMESGTALDRIAGEIGTQLTVKYLREGEIYTVNLIRQQVEIESVTEEMLDRKVGYIRITSFNQKTAEQFLRSLNTVLSNNAAALVIDIRQNSGGVYSSVKPMLNRILPAAIAATAEYKNGTIKPLIETDSEQELDIPIAVLVDSGTAAAAELFAVALKDDGKAILVGTQTSGKSVILTTYEFPDGRALTIPTAKIIPSRSEPYDGVGIKPDYVVELPAGLSVAYLEHEADTQLIKALEVLVDDPAEPD
ncbi:MAG: PDZ domain-containing protein [Oscillospiraceae bacterium]|nr:PDZ domain-containing protein [Oscillospiraceae bacterium]